MCDLCSEDQEEREKARRSTAQAGERLKVLGCLLARVSEGFIEPHSTDAKIVRERAKDAIRYLVAEWL